MWIDENLLHLQNNIGNNISIATNDDDVNLLQTIRN